MALKDAQEIGNVPYRVGSKACPYYGISRETYYQWKRAYQERGKEGLINEKPCPENRKLRTTIQIKELILHLRKIYHPGQRRIKWYLERNHDIKVTKGAVYIVLKKNGLNRLFKNQRKNVPGHRIQIYVKFLDLDTVKGKTVKCFQYTAIDDAIRSGRP